MKYYDTALWRGTRLSRRKTLIYFYKTRLEMGWF